MTAILCRLADRAVLAVSGEDRFDFLNTLLSADMPPNVGGATLAALLTPQGKLLADLLCYTDEGRVLIDFPAGSAFAKRLQMYKLRAAIAVDVLDDWQVATILPLAPALADEAGEAGGLLSDFGTGQFSGEVRRFVDPRSPDLGERVLGPGLAVPRSNATSSRSEISDAQSLQNYDRARIAAVIPEGPVDLPPNKALLMESGFERLGGLDFRKGCYVGQEVTARMKYRNLGKKRMMTLSADTAMQPGEPVLAGERQAGEILSAVNGMALGLMRHAFIDGELQLESGAIVRVTADPDRTE